MNKYKVEFGFKPFFGKVVYFDDFVVVEASNPMEAKNIATPPDKYKNIKRSAFELPLIKVSLIK